MFIDLFRIWRYTTAVVLVGVTAALYAALLLPFKIVTIIPGFTEFRPGIVVPVVFSFLFGPVAAWGGALGNIIGDMLGGTFGTGSIFGALGNFLLGYLPYPLYTGLYKREEGKPIEPAHKVWGHVLIFFISSAACAITIGWGLAILNIFPYTVFTSITFANNFLISGFLAPLLLAALKPRVERLHILSYQIFGPSKTGRYFWVGFSFLIIGCVFGIAIVFMPLLPDSTYAHIKMFAEDLKITSSIAVAFIIVGTMLL